MKLAWLCYRWKEHWGEEHPPEIHFEEPERYLFEQVVPIVWMEIVK